MIIGVRQKEKCNFEKAFNGLTGCKLIEERFDLNKP